MKAKWTHLDRGFIRRPPLEVVRGMLEYDPNTGMVRWLQDHGTKRAGDVAKITKSGYLHVTLFGYGHPVHHIAVLLTSGQWPPCVVDHINGVRSDNRIVNLRCATYSQNSANCTPKGGALGVKGVYLDKKTRRYKAQIMRRGKIKALGSFATVEDAQAAYMAAARRLFGEFAFDGNRPKFKEAKHGGGYTRTASVRP